MPAAYCACGSRQAGCAAKPRVLPVHAPTCVIARSRCVPPSLCVRASEGVMRAVSTPHSLVAHVWWRSPECRRADCPGRPAAAAASTALAASAGQQRQPLRQQCRGAVGRGELQQEWMPMPQLRKCAQPCLPLSPPAPKHSVSTKHQLRVSGGALAQQHWCMFCRLPTTKMQGPLPLTRVLPALPDFPAGFLHEQ
jgi:hypothetical protein